MLSSGTDEYIKNTVRKYSQTLFKTAYTVLHSGADAEDIVQEVFLRLLYTRPKFRDGEHEKAWLIRVTVNLSRNRLKHSSRRSVSLDECRELVQPQKDTDVLDAVLALPEKYSTVIHLYYYEGYSIAEIGAILKIPPATVGTRLRRGRAVLKSILEGDICG